MMNRTTFRKHEKPARRGLALLAGFVLLFGSFAFAETVTTVTEEEIDLLDFPDINPDDIEDIEILPKDATLNARDLQWHTPGEGSLVQCDHEVCYWKLPMGYTDEEAVWQVLMQPITVLDDGSKNCQRKQFKIRKDPDSECKEFTGEVTGSSQGVHVLDRGEEWSLIEAYSSSTEGSKVKVWALKFQGYVETKYLKEVEVDDTYALVIDKQWQRLYVYKEGHLFSTLLCSTGFYNPKKKNPWNETPAGEFLCISWTGDFKLKSEETGEDYMLCENAIRINDGILIHKVPYLLIQRTGEWQYERCEGVLGEKASHGCVRVQRKLTPEGVSHDWLWKNLSDGTKAGKKFTKVIIWDDAGRTLGYPSDDLTLYYNPDGGIYYHAQEKCYSATEDCWPFRSFTYGELDEKPYSKLKCCPYCNPMPRRDKIDEINKKNNR